MNLRDLDKARAYMLEEIEADRTSGNLYLSARLSARGQADYPELLRKAAQEGTPESLAREIRAPGRLNAKEPRRKPKGGMTMADVPHTAAETLADSEFNRFYLRGLCRYALEHGIEELVIYRAKAVENPRTASQAKIGTRVSPQRLLEDLRASIGTDTALGLPAGPNSGLSAKLPDS